MTVSRTLTIRPSGKLTSVSIAAFLASNLLFAPSAFALDATDFINGLQQEMSKRGNSLSFQTMEDDGAGGAEIKNLKLQDGKSGNVITIETMLLTGTERLGENGYQFDELSADGFSMVSSKSGTDNVLRIDSIKVSDFSYPDLADRNNAFWPLNMGSGEFTKVRLDGKGKDPFSALFPSIRLDKLKSTGGNAFTLGQLETDAATGSFINSGNTEGTFVLGNINVLNGAYFGGSGYSIEDVQFGKFTFEGTNENKQKIDITFDGMEGQNFYSPDFNSDGDIEWPTEDMVFTSRGALFNLDGQDIFTLKGASSKTTFDADAKSYNTIGKVDDIFINIDAIPVQKGQEASRKQFTDLGYSSINLDIDLKGAWNIESGIINLEQYRFSAEDMAALDINTVIGGFTVDFAKQISKISNKMNAADEDIKQAMAMQMLALYSGLELNSLAISIDDDSLTKRILDQQAKKSGQEAKDLVAAMPFMAGAVLSQLNVPTFAASTSAAIGAFLASALNETGSLSISAKPDEPISFAEIMGIVAGVQAGNVPPSDVIDRLKIDVYGQ